MAPRRLRFVQDSRFVRYGVFLLATGLAFAGVWVGVAWLDPYSLFGRIASGVFRPLVIGANNIFSPVGNALGLRVLYRVAQPPFVIPSFIALGVLVGLVAVAAWRGRWYCNTICPVGTLLGACSKHALFQLQIDKSLCEKCGDCLQVCKAQCIDLKNQEQRTQLGKTHFHKRLCIVHTDGIDCAACSEHCPTKAVYTVPYRGHLLRPHVNEDLCIGCGACEFACPVRPERAISVGGSPIQTLAAPAKSEAPAPQPDNNEFPF